MLQDSGLAATDTSSSNHSSGASSSGSTDTGKVIILSCPCLENILIITFSFQASSTSSLTHKLASLGLGSKDKEKEHKRTFSLPGRNGNNKDKVKDTGVRNKQATKDNLINNSESGIYPLYECFNPSSIFIL